MKPGPLWKHRFDHTGALVFTPWSEAEVLAEIRRLAELAQHGPELVEVIAFARSLPDDGDDVGLAPGPSARACATCSHVGSQHRAGARCRHDGCRCLKFADPVDVQAERDERLRYSKAAIVAAYEGRNRRPAKPRSGKPSGKPPASVPVAAARSRRYRVDVRRREVLTSSGALVEGGWEVFQAYVRSQVPQDAAKMAALTAAAMAENAERRARLAPRRPRREG